MNPVCFLFKTPSFPSWLSITPPCFPNSGACIHLLFLHFLLELHSFPWDLCSTSWTEILQTECFLSHFHSDFSLGWNNFLLNLHTTLISYPPKAPAYLFSFPRNLTFYYQIFYFLSFSPIVPNPSDALHSSVFFLLDFQADFSFSI